MKLFGVTGGVGMGKSTLAGLLRQSGVAVTDTDEIARRLVEPGRPAVEEIRRAFGGEVMAPGGAIDRKALARLVFADDDARAKLEAILHPPIRAAWQAETAQWRAERRERGAVVIPLLFETAARPLFDAAICVACSGHTQWERLRQRGWSDAEIRQRIEAQWPAARKMAQSDYVIWTDGPLAATAAQLAIVIAEPAG